MWFTENVNEATRAQIEYIELLMDKLGYDEQDLDIDLENLSKEKAGELIDSLKAELGW